TAPRTSTSIQSSALHQAGRRLVAPGAGRTPAPMRREHTGAGAAEGAAVSVRARRRSRAQACRFA
ncbi:MAG TPA: hypothetical protein VM712_18030, partial [Gaiellales bacterium]|nr:hypothetical protein [Gaiellales bacterium]